MATFDLLTELIQMRGLDQTQELLVYLVVATEHEAQNNGRIIHNPGNG